MNLDTDTIVAISTPPGRGGIGIVRLSGTAARAIAEPMLQLQNPLAPTRARFAKILDLATGEPLDEAVVTFFAAPHSYTTEDVVEIACHGAPVLLEALLRTAIAAGARLAQPGEFTQRAFLAGRLDLTAAEAVNDLISASTLHQARVAAAQLGGSIVRTLAPVKARLIQLIATLEAGVDFAEDDIDLLPLHEILAQIEAIRTPLQSLAATYSYGRILRQGFTLAIVGRPNVGKSSLFNRLLERDRAIVTAHPGTTRDPISERLALAGVPVELVDTAGLRDVPAGPEGEAEQQGILRSRATMAEADLVLHVLDPGSFLTSGSDNAASEPPALHPKDMETLASLEARPHLVILNKIDLLSPSRDSTKWDATKWDSAKPALTPAPLLVSARTGLGLEALKLAILAALAGTPPAADTALLTNLRQHAALTEAVTALAQAHAAAAQQLPHELLLVDLYTALTALDTLTGQTTPDEVLNLIFSTFCIGK